MVWVNEKRRERERGRGREEKLCMCNIFEAFTPNNINGHLKIMEIFLLFTYRDI